MVEAVDAVPAEVEGAREPAQRRAALEQGDLRAGLLQAKGEDRAEDASADDADSRTTSAPQLAHGDRTPAGVTARSHATSSRRRGPDCCASMAAGASAPSGDSGGGWMRPTM